MMREKKKLNGLMKNRIFQIGYRIASFEGIVMVIAFIAVFLIFSIIADNFLTGFAISNIITFASVYGIIVIGVCLLMISGELDLSVGSNFAATGFIFGHLLIAGIHPVLAMLIAMMFSTLLGLVNGLIVVYSGIPSFIVTMGTLLAYRGLARFLGTIGESSGGSVSYRPEPAPLLFSILNRSFLPINKLFNSASNFRTSTFWFLGIIIITTIVLRYTRYGNWVFATGGNLEAAIAQGVNVKLVKIVNFMLVGLFVGLGSVIFFAQRLSISESIGRGVEFTALAACVLGGAKLQGGKGSIIAAAIGILLISMLEQGLVLMGVGTTIFWGIVGLIIIISMIFNNFIEKRTEIFIPK